MKAKNWSFKAFLATQNWTALAILLVLVVAVSTPIYYRRILVPPADTDYGAHIEFTMQLLHRDAVPPHILSHPFLQLCVGFVYWISRNRIGLWESMIIVLVAAQAAVALIFYFWLGKLSGRLGELWRVFWSITLTLVAPVMILAPLDGAFYYGYIGLASYHNPTVHLLRPLALFSFVLVLRAFEEQKSVWGWVSISALVIIISALAKQNYVMSILPALACMATLRKIQKTSVNWRMLLGGVMIPGVIVLVLQALVMYSVPEVDSSGIAFAPFMVESAFSDHLLWKFLLSALFPLVLLVVDFRRVIQSPTLQLAWIAFLGGAAQTYLLAESGEREMHANFRWSAQITLFLLFAASIRYFARALPTDWKARAGVWAAYLAHLAGGIVYYVYCFTQAGYG